jgi:hypothetical protein
VKVGSTKTHWVIRYRSLRAENRSMSAVPQKRRKVRPLASVAKGHGNSRRDPLQHPAMVMRFPSPTSFANSPKRIFSSLGMFDIALPGGGASLRLREGSSPDS